MSDLEANAGWEPTNGSVDEGRGGHFSFASDKTTLVGHSHIMPSKEKGNLLYPTHIRGSTIPPLPASHGKHPATLGKEHPSQPPGKRSPPSLAVDSEEFKMSTALISSATSKFLTPSNVGDLDPEDVGKVMEEHGTSLMIYHLSLIMHQRSGWMLANIRQHKDAVFGDGNWLERNSDLLTAEQFASFKEVVSQWGIGHQEDWEDIVDSILFTPCPSSSFL
ncbi:hypothetical protein BKA70DRAFT_1222296 [Coprinopsis sp. MPI-PUGE-AT-0042]|nr:hypothetical protein BKA70DRAFT_1222296 [Coprinopsis sp. MPI-PUGE-AT-0042]